MRMSVVRIGAVLLAGGMLTAAQVPALAAPRLVQPTLSISAKSALPKVTGDVWTVFRVASAEHAQISGTVSNGLAGQVLRLFASRFPYKGKPVRVGSPGTVTAPTTPSTLTVTPGLATKYTANLYPNSTST